MPTSKTCKSCHSPALAGMYYCSRCLLTPVTEGPSAKGDPSIPFQPGSKIDRFEILESLGVGGFSEVFSVKDGQSPNRPPLALKVMRMGIHSAEFLSRFEQEHFLLRRLEDPGIVRVFESGLTEDGRPYYVMEQIDGLRITDYCNSERLSLETRVTLLIDVCRAVHHAHQKGIIHRDLKPANILVAYHEGKSIPYVIDFGLAKAVDSWCEPSPTNPSEAWVTRLGVTMGTPGYTSPEQEEGIEETDTLSDTFSLGAVLYELVTKSPPWPHETWKQIPHSKWSDYKRKNAPCNPSLFDPISPAGRRVDDDLDTICLKALATDRSQRYESVSQLATDLKYWLRGDPILARPPTLAYRLRKIASHYRWQSATLIATLGACLVAAVFGITLAIRERRYSTKLAIERSAAVAATNLATEMREVAIHERTVAQRSAYASSINLATIQIANGQPHLGEQILHSTEATLRGWEWSYLTSLIPSPVLSVPTGLNDPVLMAVSGNQKFAAISDGKSISRIDLASPIVPHKTFESLSRIRYLAISNDGQYIAVITTQESPAFIKVYRHDRSSIASEPLPEVWSHPTTKGASVAWTSDGSNELIVIEGNGPTTGRVQKIDSNGQVVSQLELKRWKIASKGLLAGKDRAIIRCSFDRLAVLRLDDWFIEGYVYGIPNSLIEDFEFNPGETRVVFSQGRFVFEAEWDQPNGDVTSLTTNSNLREVLKIGEEFGTIHRINRSPEIKWMAITDTHCLVEGADPVLLPSKNETQRISLLDGTYATILPHGMFEIRSEVQLSEGNRFWGRSVNPLPEGRRAVISPNSLFCLYQTWSRQDLFRVSIREDSNPQVFETPPNQKLEWSRLPSFHPDGTAIQASLSESAHGEKTSQLMTLRWDGKEAIRKSLPIHTTPWSAAASPDGKSLYVGTVDGVAVVDWSSSSLSKEWRLSNGPFVVMPMADNSGVFAIGKDHLVHRLSLQPGEESTHRIIDKTPGTYPAKSDYQADEQLLAISESSAVSIFALGKLPALVDRIPVETSVTSLRFSPDGKRLAIATDNRKITIWDWRGKHRLLELPTRGTCSSMDFSLDGKSFVNTDYDPCLTIR